MFPKQSDTIKQAWEYLFLVWHSVGEVKSCLPVMKAVLPRHGTYGGCGFPLRSNIHTDTHIDSDGAI